MQENKNLASKLEKESSTLEQSIKANEEKVKKNEELVTRLQGQLEKVEKQNKELQKKLQAELLAKTGASSEQALERNFEKLKQRKAKLEKETADIQKETEKIRGEIQKAETERQTARNNVAAVAERERENRDKLEQQLRRKLERLAKSNDDSRKMIEMMREKGGEANIEASLRDKLNKCKAKQSKVEQQRKEESQKGQALKSEREEKERQEQGEKMKDYFYFTSGVFVSVFVLISLKV